MFTVREAVGVAAVIVGAATLTAVAHHAGGQGTHARQAVEQAAHRLTYREVADAWARTRVGDTTRLDAIVRGVPLRFRATHQDGDAVILTFASQGGSCVDLVARPGANTVRSDRRC
jgi:hypothetical protein